MPNKICQNNNNSMDKKDNIGFMVSSDVFKIIYVDVFMIRYFSKIIVIVYIYKICNFYIT